MGTQSRADVLEDRRRRLSSTAKPTLRSVRAHQKCRIAHHCAAQRGHRSHSNSNSKRRWRLRIRKSKNTDDQIGAEAQSLDWRHGDGPKRPRASTEYDRYRRTERANARLSVGNDSLSAKAQRVRGENESDSFACERRIGGIGPKVFIDSELDFGFAANDERALELCAAAKKRKATIKRRRRRK